MGAGAGRREGAGHLGLHGNGAVLLWNILRRPACSNSQAPLKVNTPHTDLPTTIGAQPITYSFPTTKEQISSYQKTNFPLPKNKFATTIEQTSHYQRTSFPLAKNKSTPFTHCPPKKIPQHPQTHFPATRHPAPTHSSPTTKESRHTAYSSSATKKGQYTHIQLPTTELGQQLRT